jgi:hypothetical protein
MCQPEVKGWDTATATKRDGAQFMKTEDLHVEAIPQGDRGRRQGFGVSVDAMRRHYRRWLLGAALATVAGIVVSVSIMSVQRPPKEAADMVDKIRLGMSRAEANRILHMETMLGGLPTMETWIQHSMVFGAQEKAEWVLYVEIGEDGRVIRRELTPHWTQRIWYLRAWDALQARFPALPDLPF